MRLGDLRKILQTFVNTHSTQFMIKLTIFYRPDVAGAVLQTASSMFDNQPCNLYSDQLMIFLQNH